MPFQNTPLQLKEETLLGIYLAETQYNGKTNSSARIFFSRKMWSEK